MLLSLSVIRVSLIAALLSLSSSCLLASAAYFPTADADAGGSTTAGLPIGSTKAAVVHALAKLQFTAVVPVKWSASCGSITGSITAAAVYTAPAAAGKCTITATANGIIQGQCIATVSIANFTGWKRTIDGAGAITDEYELTPANVSSTHLSWSKLVDGDIPGEPLYLNGITIGGGACGLRKARNVVFVATTHDSVYAFDADNGCLLWSKSLIPPGATSVTTNLTGLPFEIGVLSTPVIDPASHTLYLVAETAENNPKQFIYRLHALDVFTGNEKFSGPVVISDPAIPPTTFYKLQRPALLLSKGNIFVAFGSIHDRPDPALGVYHGLMFVYNASSLARLAGLNTTPSGHKGGGGIWMGAGGPTADSNGDVYIAVGNGFGNFDPTLHNYGESVLKLSPSMHTLDYFTPFNWLIFDDTNNDFDLGSSNVLVVPPHGGSHPNELIVCGKNPRIYVLNRDNLGHVGATSDNQIIQRIDNQLGGAFNLTHGQDCYTSPSIWKNNNVYWVANFDVMKMFTLNSSTGMLSTTPTKRGTFSYGLYGANPIISAKGNSNGIVWTIYMGSDRFHSMLMANDANDVSKLLYHSTSLPAFPPKWMAPTVINGHIYLGLKGMIAAYSLH